jgi:uncharacterized protein YjcR
MDDKCGAKTRNGGNCKNHAYPNGRCRFHGGTNQGAPKGNANAVTHGIYSAHFTADEKQNFHAIQLGTVDEEIRLTRIRLSRALAAEQIAQGLPELDEVTENDGGGENIARESRKKKVRDYNQLVDRMTARIESLEKTRKALDSGNGDNDSIVGFEVVPYDDE